VTGFDGPHVSAELEGICPCGKKFFVDSKNYAVIHEMPMCNKFEALEPDEFLKYVRLNGGALTRIK
jgi:hypothetical protein